MAVAFDEALDSPRFHFGFDGHTAVRKGYIAWGDLEAFVAEHFPVSYKADVSQFGGLGTPFPSPWDQALRIDSMDVEPFSDENLAGPTDGNGNIDTTQDFSTVITHDKALVTIKYTPAKWTEDDPVEQLVHRWSAGAEFLTLPNTDLQWVDPAGPVSSDLSPGRLIPTINHTISWPRIESPPFANIRALVGRVNNAAFTLATGTAPYETMLFVGADLERTVMSDGTRGWNVTYHFSEKSVDTESADINEGVAGGWNHFWRNESGASYGPGFYALARDANRTPIYPRGDFNLLFQSG